MDLPFRALAFFRSAVLMIALTLFVAPASALGDDDPARDESTNPDKTRGLVIVPVPFYTPETSGALATVVLYHIRDTERLAADRPSILQGTATVTANEQWVAATRAELYFRSKWNLEVEGVVTEFPSLFYGLGSDTDEGAEEEYTERQRRLRIVPRRRFSPRFSAGFELDVENMDFADVSEGGSLSSGRIRGSGGAFVAGVGLVALYDSRDNLFCPRRGIYAEGGAILFAESLGSDLAFETYRLDVRYFRELRERTVLALHALTSSARGEVPFYRLGLLGGESLMRGIYEGRFRDRDLVALEGELRRNIKGRLGMAVFAAAGSVAPTFGDIEKIHATGGAGLRWRLGKVEPIQARLDVALGPDGARIYLALNEAF